MNVEIVTIGDELMTGHTVDSNGTEIARQLTALGLEITYRTSVGDSVEAMEDVLRLALQRARVVITTGGLGPTEDDLTKRVIVKVFQRNLIFHEEILNQLQKRWSDRGAEMPAINQNQALLPQGATFFPNRLGSAVGICIAEEGRVFIALPGVPSEMHHILESQVVPYLKNLKGARSTKVISVRTTGIPESRLAELIMPSLKLEPGVKLAFLPSFSGTDLRIIASSDTQAKAAENAEKLASQIENKCRKYVYGRDRDRLESVVGQLLKDNDKTVSLAESCTGGQLGQLITSTSGSSTYFVGGVVAYRNEIKSGQLSVDSAILQRYGAVSEECAKAMARGARALFQSDFALSVTGIAGPEGGTEDKPVGTTYIGLASAHTDRARLFNFGSDREANRTRACFAALEVLRREILDIE